MIKNIGLLKHRVFKQLLVILLVVKWVQDFSNTHWIWLQTIWWI